MYVKIFLELFCEIPSCFGDLKKISDEDILESEKNLKLLDNNFSNSVVDKLENLYLRMSQLRRKHRRAPITINRFAVKFFEIFYNFEKTSFYF